MFYRLGKNSEKPQRGRNGSPPPLPPRTFENMFSTLIVFLVRTDAYCNVVSKLITMPYLINKVCLAISKTNFYGHREKIVSRDLVD